MTTTEQTAAAAGASATEAFRASMQGSAADVPAERISAAARAVLDGVHSAIREHGLTYPEFQAAKQWLIEVGEAGEWPLFLDVFVEHAVEEVASKQWNGSQGTILGPYYLPDQPRLPASAALPMRAEEPGTPMVFTGQVRDVTGTPIAGAELDIWQADGAGDYSGFAAGVPDGNLRGVVVTGEDGRFEVRTMRPAPYQIPTDGPTGKLIAAADWHAWRPAHVHLIVRAEGHRPITTQLYFDDDKWLDSDVASATKPELVLSPSKQQDGSLRAEYDFELEPAR